MTFEHEGRVVFFATNNIHKFFEAREVLGKSGIAVGMIRVKGLEVQSNSLEEIAQSSVVDAFGRCKLPMIVEDAGLFIDTLNGFPGPYSAYVHKTIGNKGLLRLMEGFEERNARFESAVAFLSASFKSPKCFLGQVTGRIVNQERLNPDRSPFGFDPVFQPQGSDRTFAEMSLFEKNMVSHRADAMRKFAEWYKDLAVAE